jgi:hypothetical protein
MTKTILHIAPLALLLTTACATDPNQPATNQNAELSAVSAPQALRLFQAGSTSDYFAATFLEFGFAQSTDVCVTRTETGAVQDLVFACDRDGEVVRGEMIITNKRSLTRDPDPSKPSSTVFKNFSLVTSGPQATTIVVNGSIDSRVGKGLQDTAVDLTVASSGGVVRTVSVFSCSTKSCTPSEFWLDMEGVGRVTVEQSSDFNYSVSTNTEGLAAKTHGTLKLVGKQTLLLDLDNDTDTCIPYSIDGKATGQACQ